MFLLYFAIAFYIFIRFCLFLEGRAIEREIEARNSSNILPNWGEQSVKNKFKKSGGFYG